MTHLKRWLLRWLGIDAMIANAVDAERAARVADMAVLGAECDDVTSKLATALRTAVGQLNYNTTTIQRWAKESATLNQIEERHARKAKAGIELVNGNGASRIVGLDSAS